MEHALTDMKQEQLIDWFIAACSNGNLEAIKALVDFAGEQASVIINHKNEKGFRTACAQGHLTVVQYLANIRLAHGARVDIHAATDYGFRWACRNGHLDVVRYLLTSPELKTHADIHALGNEAIMAACESGHVEIVKFLLSSPELKVCSKFIRTSRIYANIHVEDDECFKVACRRQDRKLLQYLIVDYGIRKTRAIAEYIKDKPEVKKIFEFKKLTGHLPIKQYKKSRNKV